VTLRAGIVVSICKIYKNILIKFRKINQNNNPFRRARPGQNVKFVDQGFLVSTRFC
jgi:hypothetical protein